MKNEQPSLRQAILIPRIFREVYGQSAPPEEVCPFSFIIMQDLENSARALALRPGMNPLDLACGGAGQSGCISRNQTSAAPSRTICLYDLGSKDFCGRGTSYDRAASHFSSGSRIQDGGA